MPITNDKRMMARIVLVLCLVFSSTSVFAGASSTVFRFQQTMAEKGLPQAQYKLGMMYETGSAVEHNLIQAKLWYGRAAFQNYKPAQHRLTYLDIKQNGFTPQHEQWVRDLKQDAAFGNGEALLLLGQMYADGTGLQQDLDKSIRLLRKASAANVPGSETELVRVENIQLARQEHNKVQQQAEQKRLAQIEQQKRAEQLKQKQLREQRQRKLQLERARQEKKLIAERERKRRLAAEQKRQKQLASQRALEAALREPMLVTETTDSEDICSGSNRFSATCR